MSNSLKKIAELDVVLLANDNSEAENDNYNPYDWFSNLARIGGSSRILPSNLRRGFFGIHAHNDNRLSESALLGKFIKTLTIIISLATQEAGRPRQQTDRAPFVCQPVAA